MTDEKFEIQIVGTDAAMAMLARKPKATLRAMRLGMRDTTLSIRARTKQALAAGPHPLSRTGALSRSIINDVSDDGAFMVRGIVGSTMPYRTGYAAILEKGGPIPEIVPRNARVLVFPNTRGAAGMSYHATLQSGGTIKQAIKALKHAASRSGEQPFVFAMRVRARYQRAYPYLGPSFDAERPLIDSRFRPYIAAVMKGDAGGES